MLQGAKMFQRKLRSVRSLSKHSPKTLLGLGRSRSAPESQAHAACHVGSRVAILSLKLDVGFVVWDLKSTLKGDIAESTRMAQCAA